MIKNGPEVPFFRLVLVALQQLSTENNNSILIYFYSRYCDRFLYDYGLACLMVGVTDVIINLNLNKNNFLLEKSICIFFLIASRYVIKCL